MYLDNIVIFSTTVEQHLSRLRDVLARLKKTGLKLKPSKCHILRKSVHYLGHIVSADGVKVDHDKLSALWIGLPQRALKNYDVFWELRHTSGSSLKSLLALLTCTD